MYLSKSWYKAANSYKTRILFSKQMRLKPSYLAILSSLYLCSLGKYIGSFRWKLQNSKHENSGS